MVTPSNYRESSVAPARASAAIAEVSSAALLPGVLKRSCGMTIFFYLIIILVYSIFTVAYQIVILVYRILILVYLTVILVYQMMILVCLIYLLAYRTTILVDWKIILL